MVIGYTWPHTAALECFKNICYNSPFAAFRTQSGSGDEDLKFLSGISE
jgi:hypothetical protein